MSSPVQCESQSGVKLARSLRQSELTLVSRQLHSQIGPSLCAIGLHLGLLREAVSGSPEARESLAAIESVLSETIQSIRSLTYRTDPRLVERCGLRPALEYFCADFPVDLKFAEEPAGFASEQAVGAYDAVQAILYEFALLDPEQRILIEAGRKQLSLCPDKISPSNEIPSEATLAALRSVADENGLTIERRQKSGEVVISANERGGRA